MPGKGLEWVYNSKRWKALRRDQLAKEPTCRYCLGIGVITAASVVDHIKPHKGDKTLAFDPANLQSLCKPCHDSLAAIKDNGGTVPGCDDNGIPMDPNHPWSA